MKYNFGKTIEILRVKKGLSQREVASILKISPTYLCDIEKNKRNPPGIEILTKLKEIYNLGESEFVYMCNIAAEQTQACPEDILKAIYTLQSEIRFSIWNDVRKAIEELKGEV